MIPGPDFNFIFLKATNTRITIKASISSAVFQAWLTGTLTAADSDISLIADAARIVLTNIHSIRSSLRA